MFIIRSTYENWFVLLVLRRLTLYGVSKQGLWGIYCAISSFVRFWCKHSLWYFLKGVKQLMPLPCAHAVKCPSRVSTWNIRLLLTKNTCDTYLNILERNFVHKFVIICIFIGFSMIEWFSLPYICFNHRFLSTSQMKTYERHVRQDSEKYFIFIQKQPRRVRKRPETAPQG